MDETSPYNPLSKRNLASSIVTKLLRQEAQKLPPPDFPGAGLYLLYYCGKFETYRKISEPNQKGFFSQPIYVGKAIPKGGRKGLEGFDVPHGRVLFDRLRQHSDSIQAATNLNLDDFRCRWLVVDEVFIPLGESLLITHFKPLWNAVLDGFGNHDPGERRHSGRKPLWDILHPGRRWAEKMKAEMSVKEVRALAFEYLEKSAQPPSDIAL
ncbi:MAG TPA: Eco29kI family restriction endonuclease [Verrucomicrobiae bacterium]|nr:Eco29kI family restriction endonuclease [Verrucomicrobiae bacterium]